jgi:hypothetical protein
VAVLDVSQFATYSRFTQTPNYIDSDAPPVKFQFLLRFNIVVVSKDCEQYWMASENSRSQAGALVSCHTERLPVRVR